MNYPNLSAVTHVWDKCSDGCMVRPILNHEEQIKSNRMENNRLDGLKYICVAICSYKYL